MKKAFLLITLSTISIFVSAQNKETDSNDNSLILGSWVSENDSAWQLVFDSTETCTQYYENKIIEINSYKISNSTPQCEIEVETNNKTQYLNLKEKNSNEETCYQVYGISKTNFTISPLEIGGYIIFKRQ